jgi:hypothetical protein
MITSKHLEKTEIQLFYLENFMESIIEDLEIPKKEYQKKYIYATGRRMKEAQTIKRDLENLKGSLNWIRSKGLVDKEVRVEE